MKKDNLRDKCKIKAYQLIQQCSNMGKLAPGGAENTTDIHYWTDEEKEEFGFKDETKEVRRTKSVNYWMKYYMEEECVQSVWYAMRDYGFSFDFRVSVTPDYIKVRAWKI